MAVFMALGIIGGVVVNCSESSSVLTFELHFVYSRSLLINHSSSSLLSWRPCTMGVVFVNTPGLYCGNWVISLSWSTQREETCITLSKNFTLNMVVYLFVIPDTGDIVRVQPNHLSFTSAAALRDMHGSKVVPVKAGIYKNLFQPPGVVDRESFLGTLFSYPLSSCAEN